MIDIKCFNKSLGKLPFKAFEKYWKDNDHKKDTGKDAKVAYNLLGGKLPE
jgi:hypothetical protein